MSSFKRLLKLAEKLHEDNDTKGLQKLEMQFQNYIKAHYVAENDGTTPTVWRHNLDYAAWENSPFRGSMSDFLKEFPGGLKDWLDWRKKTKKERFKNWDIKTRKAKLEYMMKTGKTMSIKDRIQKIAGLMDDDEEVKDSPALEEATNLIQKIIDQLKQKGVDDETIKNFLRKEIFGEKVEMNAKDNKEGSKAYVGSIEKDTEDNDYFRKVLFTGKHSQLVVMSLKSEEEIGMETHPDVDQFFRIEEGEADFILDGEKHHVEAGGAVTIPAGTEHNVINTSKTEPLQVYTIYSPPNHPAGTVHKTKEDAQKAEKEEHKVEDDDNDLREQLADLEHKQWTHWTKYMLDHLTDEDKKRWEKEMATDYKDLSEKEKDGDREWADKVLDILKEKKIKVEAHYVPVGPDDTKKFNKEPHLFSEKGPGKYKSIKEFLKTYRKHYGHGQSADDAAQSAVKDMINYWKLLLKAKNRRGKHK